MGDLGEHLVGHPVEDGDEGDLVLLGGAQQVPGHGVRVPGGGGDHDPDVGGADEFGGQGAVVDHEGVDVGGVEEGEAAGQGGDGLDAYFAVLALAVAGAVGGAGVAGVAFGFLLALRQPDPQQVGKYAHAGEPVVVVGVTDEDRRSSGRAQHAGFADLPAHERVDEGGLAGAGGTSDDGEQGRLGCFEARYEVVVELREQLRSGLAGARGTGQGQRQTHGGDPVAQRGEGIEQLGPNIQGHHMRRMPNFASVLKLIDSLRADRHSGGTPRTERTTGAQA